MEDMRNRAIRALERRFGVNTFRNQFKFERHSPICWVCSDMRGNWIKFLAPDGARRITVIEYYNEKTRARVLTGK